MSKLNLRKRGTKWEYRFEVAKVNGKRKQISKGGFALKKDCIQAGTEAMNLYFKKGTIFEASKMSFADYLDFWLDHYAKSNCSYSTMTQYKRKIEKHIKPTLGAFPLCTLRTKQIQEVLYKKKDEGLSRQTVHLIYAVISSALSYAVNPLEYIEYNPCNAVKLPKFDAKPKEKEIITMDMYKEIIKLTGKNTEYATAITISYYTGLRIGEVFGLTWSDIDFTEKTISVNKQVQKQNNQLILSTLKTASSNRIVKCNSQLMDYLQKEKQQQKQNEMKYGEFYTDYFLNPSAKEIRAERRDNSELVHNKDYQNISFVIKKENGEIVSQRAMQEFFKKVSRKLRCNVTFHSLRHSHATMLAENVGEQGIKAIQERLGHSNATVTMDTYMHNTEAMENKLVDILEKIAE